MANDSPPPVPPPDSGSDKVKSQASEARTEFEPKSGSAADRTTAAKDTEKSQSDEVSKAHALMKGFGDAAGQLVEGVKSLAVKAKEHVSAAGDVAKQAGAVGVVAGVSLLHSPAGVEATQYFDQAGEPAGHTLVDPRLAGRGAAAISEHGGTMTTPGGEKVQYAFVRPAEAPTPEPDEGPATEFVEKIDEGLVEVEKSLRDRDEQLEHPVIEGEFDV